MSGSFRNVTLNEFESTGTTVTFYSFPIAFNNQSVTTTITRTICKPLATPTSKSNLCIFHILLLFITSARGRVPGPLNRFKRITGIFLRCPRTGSMVSGIFASEKCIFLKSHFLVSFIIRNATRTKSLIVVFRRKPLTTNTFSSFHILSSPQPVTAPVRPREPFVHPGAVAVQCYEQGNPPRRAKPPGALPLAGFTIRIPQRPPSALIP